MKAPFGRKKQLPGLRSWKKNSSCSCQRTKDNIFSEWCRSGQTGLETNPHRLWCTAWFDRHHVQIVMTVFSNSSDKHRPWIVMSPRKNFPAYFFLNKPSTFFFLSLSSVKLIWQLNIINDVLCATRKPFRPPWIHFRKWIQKINFHSYPS